jgi:hypothetical protein
MHDRFRPIRVRFFGLSPPHMTASRQRGRLMREIGSNARPILRLAAQANPANSRPIRDRFSSDRWQLSTNRPSAATDCRLIRVRLPIGRIGRVSGGMESPRDRFSGPTGSFYSVPQRCIERRRP